MKAERGPQARRDSVLHGFVQSVLYELSAVAVDVWLQDQISQSFRRVAAIGVTPSDLFQAPAIQQKLISLLQETIQRRMAAPIAFPGIIPDRPEASTPILLAPVLCEGAPPGIVVVVPRAELTSAELQQQLQVLVGKCAELAALVTAAFSGKPAPEGGAPTATPPTAPNGLPNPNQFSAGPSATVPASQQAPTPPIPKAAIPDTSSNQTTVTLPKTVTVPIPAPPQIVPPPSAPALPGIKTDVPPTSAPSVSVTTSPATSAKPFDLQQVLDFTLTLQRSLDPVEVAEVAANDGRLLFEADRVSVVLRRGRKAVVAAVSGQESVPPRGNLTRAMRSLAEQVLASGESLRTDISLDELPPQLQQPLVEFVQEGKARFVLMIPLWEPARLVPPEDAVESTHAVRERRKTVGVLVIEQMSTSNPPAHLEARLAAAADHIGAAIYNSRSHSSIFLLPVWRGIGRFVEWLRGRRLGIAIALLILVIATGVALAIVPWEYRVDATGRLMPVVQREVFAPWDGQVVKLMIQDGERVVAGQPLVQLRNDDLNTERVTIENRILEKRKLLASLNAQRDETAKQDQKDEIIKLQGRIVETKVELEGAQKQLEILKERCERLLVKAPIGGIVTTFQIHQMLQDRPVQRGDVLVQVMDDAGDWNLELEVPENRLGRILKQQNRQGNPAKSGTEAAGAEASGTQPTDPTLEGATPKAFSALPVEYCLLTRPETTYSATLTSLATRAVAADPQGTVIEARASLEKSNLPQCTIGAEVRARISCGQSCLGDVLFGDVVEFAQKYLWW